MKDGLKPGNPYPGLIDKKTTLCVPCDGLGNYSLPSDGLLGIVVPGGLRLCQHCNGLGYVYVSMDYKRPRARGTK